MSNIFEKDFAGDSFKANIDLIDPATNTAISDADVARGYVSLDDAVYDTISNSSLLVISDGKLWMSFTGAETSSLVGATQLLCKIILNSGEDVTILEETIFFKQSPLTNQS